MQLTPKLRRRPEAGEEEGCARPMPKRGSGNEPPLRAGKQVAAEPRPLPTAAGRDPILALGRERTQPLLSAFLLPGPPRRSRSPSGSQVKGAIGKVKARPATTWGFFPAEHELCNRIVKDHGSGRKSKGPHRSARERIYFTARNTHAEPRFQGGENVGFQDPGMWQKQNNPHPSTPPPPDCGGKGLGGPLCPRLQRSACLLGLGGLSLYRRKTTFKNTPLLLVPLSKTISVATGCGGEGKQRNGERINATEANCLPRRRKAREKEAILRTHPH